MSTHDLNIKPAPFVRITSGHQRAVIVAHDSDYQSGDLLRLFEANRYGYRERHFVERDERGRFVNNYIDNTPILVRITHVLPGSQADGITPEYCVLSVELVESLSDKLRKSLR